MDPFFFWLETTALSTWLRESSSLWVFPFMLVLHTWGLAFLVGANVTIGIRALGLVPAIPLASLRRYYWVMWAGFWVNAFSGVALLIAYPTKALTNPLFYAKLLFIGAGMVLALRLQRCLDDPIDPGSEGASRVRRLAGFGLACWAAAVPAGRFLAYTCTRLTWESPC